MKIIIFIFIITVISAAIDDDDTRRRYGLSFNAPMCKSYMKAFKCMTICKSMDYATFRLNFQCKCSCHDMRSTTILPFFMQRTNGTTRMVPKSYGPSYYAVVGKYTTPDESTTTTTPEPTIYTCPQFPKNLPGKAGGVNNTTGTGGISTGASNVKASEGTASPPAVSIKKEETAPADGATTPPAPEGDKPPEAKKLKKSYAKPLYANNNLK